MEEEFFCTLEGVFFNFLMAKKKLYIELSQIVELYKTKIHFLVLKVHLSTLSQQNDTEEDEQKITQTQRPLMFCEPKGQELNTFICSIFLEFYAKICDLLLFLKNFRY